MIWFSSKKHNVLFNHIPKNAGMTIRKGFFGTKNLEKVERQNLSKDDLKRSFAFVRHPLDRFASGLRYAIQSGWVDEKAAVPVVLDLARAKPLDFTQGTDEVKIQQHFFPQTHRLNDLLKTEYVGRFEQLDQQWSWICKCLGIPPKSLRHLNSTQKKGPIHWKETIPEKYLGEVIELYDLDFKVLQYDKPKL